MEIWDEIFSLSLYKSLSANRTTDKMDKEDEMEELFEKLPWLEEQFETEQEIIEQLVKAEEEYLKIFRKIEWVEHLD